MKFVSIILTAFYFILASCSNPAKKEVDKGISPPIDSLKIAAIDSLSFETGKLWKPDSSIFHVVAFNQRDTLKYIEVDGKIPRVSSVFITDTTLIWVVLQFDGDELVNVRYREKRDNPIPAVKESISYYDKGKIFYSKERGKELQSGETPAAFRHLPFVENKRTQAELEAEYGPFWEASKKAIEDYKAKQGK